MKKRFKRVVALLLSAVMLIGTGTIAFAQTADEATELSKKTAEQVEAEGLVMLKNEDDILPLRARRSMFSARQAPTPSTAEADPAP